ncbi:MAG TPA: acetyltransferase [Asticcacaulis sp.]|nr:acetyltransferase [Asticcacaulis sp.]
MTLPEWRFRPSRPSDAGDLYEVWRTSVAATHDFVSEADLATISIQVREAYLPRAELLVAVDDEDRPIGFMGISDQAIDSLFIAPTWRGKGLGRAFVDAADTSLTEVIVNSQNTQAVGFYERMGFRTYASSPLDDEGRPYPIFRMRRRV